MEVNFKFEIGQIVTTTESMSAISASKKPMSDEDIQYLRMSGKGKTAVPIRLVISQRGMEECPGGVQHYYTCMYWTANGYMNHKFNEVVLVEYPKD
mgnify:FL=1